MAEPALKLTSYFGERDRVGRSFLADALFEIYERHGLRASILMRGVEGFGLKHQLRTDRLLTLSEDLPIVSVAVDRPEPIRAALEDIDQIRPRGLVTLERAQLLRDPGQIESSGPEETGAEAKVTVYLGRHARLGGVPAHMEIVARLRKEGVDGATVLLGVDGTLHGSRRRARFFGANADVPLMVISVGGARALSRALSGLWDGLSEPVATLERVDVVKRDGKLLGGAGALPQTDDSGLAIWRKLMLYAGEQTHAHGRPLHVEAIRELRQAGAAGATALRGVWGYHGGGQPHGDSFWSIRRRVPTLTVIVDQPDRAARWLEVLDGITPSRGLITSEIVPAYRALTTTGERGGLRLADIPARPGGRG